MSENCPLFKLPDDIFAALANYFLPTEEHSSKIFHFSWELRHLLNANKQQFETRKQSSQMLSLGDFYAMSFKRSENFRSLVLEKIQSSRSQLELIFKSPFVYSPILLKGLPAVKKVQIEGKYILPEWPSDIEEISLQFCKFSPVSVNANTRQLRLQNSSFASTYSVNGGSFASLDSLAIAFCIIPNYHVLSNLKRLKIERCSNITDVSCFRNILDLTLSGCSQITDVSSLGNVCILELSRCEGIRDVSSLGKVHSLV
jgi:hypothetical protein